jgi:uncharacterized protein YgbK (DUF1537 family)
MPPILVIADDLSGAAELAAIAAARGLVAEVHREFDPSSRADVIAIDTDTRQPHAENVAAKISELATHPAFQQSRVFKKVDSVLRGYPRIEIEALLGALNRERAVLIPANPSRGRTIVEGKLLVEGIPLDQTGFASDGEFPRHSSSIEALLPSHGSLPLHAGKRLKPPLLSGIIVPDVASLSELAGMAAQMDDSILAAGAADFFEAMLDRWQKPLSLPRASETPQPISKPALLVCGSRVAWPQRVAACEAAKIPIQQVNGPEWVPKNDVSRPIECAVGLLGLGDQTHPDRLQALHELGELASQVIRTWNVKTLLLEGGATAAAVVSELGWKHFSVQASASPGVGYLRPIDDESAPLLLIKPGSYPWPSEIWQSFSG